MPKIYITKYALTKGILEADAEEGAFKRPNGSKVYMKVSNPEQRIWGYFYTGDYFLNLEDALRDAEAKRLKRITVLETQIERLRKKAFYGPKKL